MSIYYLNKYIHACLVDSYCIFLDEKNDEFLALPQEEAALIKEITNDGRIVICNSSTESKDGSHELNPTVKNLIMSGQITDVPILQREKIEYTPPTLDLSYYSINNEVSASFIDVAKFFRSYASTLIERNIWGNFHLLRQVGRMKVYGDIKRDIHETMHVFKTIRPFFYKSSEQCYFDCAVAMKFLKLSGYSPQWVFGVAVDPFKAHCWVKVGDTLVTDYLAKPQPFTPIMII